MLEYNYGLVVDVFKIINNYKLYYDIIIIVVIILNNG